MPEPMTTQVCVECDLPWSRHQNLAEQRLFHAWDGEQRYEPTPLDVDEAVTLHDCIALLKQS